MLLQLLEGERGAGLQLDEHLGRFLAIGIGDADHDAFVDRGMLVDRLLDHARIDVVARRDDQVLGAVDQVEPAVVVHVAHVAGAQALPVAAGMAEQHLLGLVGLLPVALHDLRADDADLADIAPCRPAARVSPFSMSRISMTVPGIGTPHEPDAAHALVDRADRAGGRGLGEAVALDQRGAGQLLEALLHLDRQGRAARHADLQRLQVEPLRLGMLQDRGVERRHAGQEGRLLLRRGRSRSWSMSGRG